MPKRPGEGGTYQNRRVRTRRPAARPYRRKRRAVATSGRIASVCKAVMLKATETKRSSQYTKDPAELFHNKAYYAGNLLATKQGVTDPAGADIAAQNRIGDEVLGRGISLRFFLENQKDHPNVIYKIYVFRYNTLQISAGLDDTYFWQGFDGSGANMNRTLDKPQTDRLKILKTMTINPYLGSMGGQGFDSVKTKMFQCWIPLNDRKIQYNADGSNFTRFTDIGFAVLAYDAVNTTEVTILSLLQWQSTFYYKDP